MINKIIIPLALISFQSFAGTIPGITEPVNTIKVTTKVEGTITSYSKDIGEKIGGDLSLAKIDDVRIKLAKELTEAELNQLHTESDYYSVKLNRYENLLKKESLSESEFEDSLFALNSTKNKIRQKEISLEQNNEDLLNTTIYGKEGYIVSKRNVEEGEYVKAATELYEIIDTRKLNVYIQVAEKNLTNFTIGQKVSVSIDEKEQEGFVKFKGVSMEEGTYAYPIIIEIDNPNNLIPVQKTVQVNYGDQ